MKTPPKQATNPLQFVKVGPCSLYRSAQEQIQKVQEIKKIEQKIREDPEDWQSVSHKKYTIFISMMEIFTDVTFLFFRTWIIGKAAEENAKNI